MSCTRDILRPERIFERVNQMRQVISFCEDWRFQKGASLPEAFPVEWENVRLPHTWNVEDGQDGGNDYWRGTAFYAKRFGCPQLEVGGRAVLDFGAAAMSADIWLNGQHLARHEGGYSRFRVDITDALREENLLCVAVDNSENDRIYPQRADFTFYGGLTREVNLILVPSAHFELLRNGTPGIRANAEVSGRTAAVHVVAWANAGEVCFRLDGQTQIVPVAEGKAEADFRLDPVHLWDGLDDPYLYTVEASLLENETELDHISTRFGCRSFMIDPQRGFFLNGRSYPLRGVSRHQDKKGKGSALSLQDHREDMTIIRELGANTLRLAHYQQSQEFYDLCDENGLIVWAEIPYISQHMRNGEENCLSQMRELIEQSYNHPSIVCWGLSNEITVGASDRKALMETHKKLQALCKELDPNRPTVMAHAFMLEQDSALIPTADLAGYNLYFGWYLGELEQNDRFLDEYHAKYPDRILGFSEYGADANPALQAARPERGDYTEGYQCLYHEHLLRCIDERPWLWATHVWNLFDFGADGRDEGGKLGENQKGLVTFDRKLRKDAFYLYKAAWSREPFVHITGKRYRDRAEAETEIKVYSNQSEVSLYLDGDLIGQQTGSRIFRFRVPINGEHRITATCGELRDEMTIRHVSEPNESYLLPGRKSVVNWFDRDLVKEGYFSIQDKLGVLSSDPDAGPIVAEMMALVRSKRGDVAKEASSNAGLQKMMAQIPLESLLRQAGGAVSEEYARELNRRLQAIPKKNPGGDGID